MRLTSSAVLCAALSALSSLEMITAADSLPQLGSSGAVSDKDSMIKEDSEYWSRLLKGNGESMSMTPAPSPSPSGIACEIEAKITCVDADGTDCDAIPPRNVDCDEPITYTYEFCNVGTNDMTVTVANRVRDGEEVNLLPLIPVDDRDLAPEECVTVTESDTLDVCVAAESKTTLTGEADPPSGIECLDTDEYTINVPDAPSPSPSAAPSPEPSGIACEIEATITCVDADGTDCDAIPPRNVDCDEPITYTYKFCNVGTNDMTVTVANRVRDGEEVNLLPLIPVDDRVLEPEECVEVTEAETLDVCIAAESKTTLTGEADPPSGIECLDTDIYTINVPDAPSPSPSAAPSPEPSAGPSPAPSPEPSAAPSPEPSGIECEIEATITCVDADGNDCDEIPPRNVDCDEAITYTYEFCNVGTNDMTITVAEYLRDGQTVILLDDIADKDLSPGECATVTEADTLDVCTEGEVKTTLTGEANPPSGMECQDTDMYIITILDAPSPSPSAAPSPSPTAITPIPSAAPSPFECDIDIEVDCVPTDGSPNCSAIPPLITLCEERPTEMIFRYNGGNCDQSTNMQQGDSPLFFCFDFQGGPPTEKGTPSFIVVTDTKGQGIDYFSGEVLVGGEFSVSNPNGGRVGANMNVTIYSSSDTSPENILQTLVYHSSCSRNLFLKDRFGSIMLILFVNEEQGVVDCFFEAEFQFMVVIAGDSDPTRIVSLESLVLPDIGLVNLTDEVADQVVGPGDTFMFSRNITIDLTVRQRYTALTTIVGQAVGDGSFGGFCSDTDFTTFIAGNALAPTVPSPAPTLPPIIPQR